MAFRLSLALILVIGLIFLPTTIFLLVGMMPTLAALAVDRSFYRIKTLCIACMNFAGCFPFLLEFWTDGTDGSVTDALRAVANLKTIIIIYVFAMGGYAIDMAVSGITSSILIQRAENRMKTIMKEQDILVKRWGEKVTGRYKLDDYGFPVTPIPDKTKPEDPDQED